MNSCSSAIIACWRPGPVIRFKMALVCFFVIGLQGGIKFPLTVIATAGYSGLSAHIAWMRSWVIITTLAVTRRNASRHPIQNFTLAAFALELGQTSEIRTSRRVDGLLQRNSPVAPAWKPNLRRVIHNRIWSKVTSKVTSASEEASNDK